MSAQCFVQSLEGSQGMPRFLHLRQCWLYLKRSGNGLNSRCRRGHGWFSTSMHQYLNVSGLPSISPNWQITSSKDSGRRVAVVSSSEGRELADRLRTVSGHASELSLFTNVKLPQLAGLIASARVFVSNDTGPMHFGPAIGVPTLGLFSVGYPEHFRPTGSHDRFLRESPIDRIEVNKAIEAAAEMWATAVDPNFRR